VKAVRFRAVGSTGQLLICSCLFRATEVFCGLFSVFLLNTVGPAFVSLINFFLTVRGFFSDFILEGSGQTEGNVL